MTLPHTTKKQKEILHLLYNHRFIDRKQIQSILKHKNHRRIHSWLTDLVEKNCIERIFSNKMPENTKPAVYYLGRNGRKILKEHFTQTFIEDTRKTATGDGTNERNNLIPAPVYQLTKTYKDSQRTAVFRSTCLALVDIAITTESFAKENGYDLVFTSLTECATYTLLTKFDSYFSLQKNKGKKKRYVFLYITNRTPKRFIRYRVAEIIKYLTQEWGYETDIPCPTVLCICANIPMRNYTKKLFETKLEYYRPDEPLNIQITTIADYKADPFEPGHWKQPKVTED